MSDGLLFVVLSLSVFIVTYVIVASEFPPAEWIRDRVRQRTGADSSWSVLVGCPWCASAYVAGAVVLLTDCIEPLPLPLLWWAATWGASAALAEATYG